MARRRYRAGYFWDRGVQRYRQAGRRGQFVAESVVQQLTADYAQVVRGNMRDLTDRLIGGEIELPAWQRAMAREVKEGHTIALLAGKGGREAMADVDWRRLGGRMAYQYGRLNRFAEDVETGALTAGQIMVRAGMYADAVRTSYYDGRTSAAREAGLVAERRIVNPALENCPDCLNYEAMGPQPIGTLPEPGKQSRCRVRCGCDKQYLNEAGSWV